MIKKKRRKTGCLTCRTRRVKCDERKPNCERCEIANVHCAGYAEKRQLKIRYDDQSSTTSGGQIPPTAAIDQYIQPNIGDGNGLPLVALPVNPNPFQRPHSRARDMLGYHQYLYRTLPILFPPKSFHFWRDYLCEAAWEMEWVFDTIIALGSIHRATLLLSQKERNDRHRGLDTKVIAIQTYIKALERLSAYMADTRSPTPLAVGALVLMAYIECFSGNLPAAIRHTQVIQCYSQSMQVDDKHPIGRFISPIESSIRDLELICRIVRPFPSPLEPSCRSNAEKLTVNLPSSFFEVAANSSSMLQQLLEFTSADLDLKHLVWCAYAAHLQTASKEKVLAFLQALDDWRSNNSAALQTLKLEDSPSEPIDFSYQVLCKLPFPPPCHEDVHPEACLALTLYTFYKARLLWALCLFEDQDSNIEVDAYFHIYQFLRYARTALKTMHQSATPDALLPCENLRVGLSPLLYLAGRCCPTPSWLRWIIQELELIGREGLFHNEPFAKTLQILLLLEELKMQSPNTFETERFVPATLRTIALLIPDIDCRSFNAYYSHPLKSRNEDAKKFKLVRVARWSDTSGQSGPIVEDYEIYDQLFCKDWLFEQPVVRKWLDWNCHTEFDLNRVIQDHITGNRLLLEAGLQ